ncbi:MAG: class I SAM-dependent methyltransferase [Actinomycetota bacterium]|nr:class I SAM-dependent methyltransferase [Actinomycetota bacterium]
MSSAWVTFSGPADLHAWHVLRPLLDGRPYLPFSSGAMRISGLVHVCNLIVHRAPGQVVECGAGVSTLVLARLLAQRGSGRLTALEHDPGWAERVEELLVREGLTDVARVVLAPLEGGWYAPAGVGQLPEAIDLLIVDGPPADRAETAEARHPALGALEPRLSADAFVILDDIGRDGEQQVLARWEQETGWRFDRLEDEAIAVGRLRPGHAGTATGPQAQVP